MTLASNLSHAATIFPVTDIHESLRFYTEQLGFSNNFSWGDPIQYAVLKCGAINLHLTQKEDDLPHSADQTALYIFVFDVDKAYQHCLDNKVPIINPPESHSYGMRDFDITDPDGFRISFGRGS